MSSYLVTSMIGGSLKWYHFMSSWAGIKVEFRFQCVLYHSRCSNSSLAGLPSSRRALYSSPYGHLKKFRIVRACKFVEDFEFHLLECVASSVFFGLDFFAGVVEFLFSFFSASVLAPLPPIYQILCPLGVGDDAVLQADLPRELWVSNFVHEGVVVVEPVFWGVRAD